MEHYTGTKPVAASHAFDTAALQAHLERELPGFRGPLVVEQFKGGQSNPTYKLLTPGSAYVMRSKPGAAAKLLPSAHAVDREFRVMKALAVSGVPVAQMHLLCADEAVIGRAFYVMEFMDGRVLWDSASTDLRDKLERNTKWFRTAMTEAGFDIIPGEHPIVPIMLYDAKLAQDFARNLLAEGIYVIGFFNPVVPQGKARIRVQVSAAHETAHLEKAVKAFTEVGMQLGVLN